MALSINEILNELDSGYTPEAPASVKPATTAVAQIVEPEKVSAYLEALASPDSMVDELAKLAVLQDFVAQHNVPMEKIASLSLEIRDEERMTMLKAASQLVRDMNIELTTLREQAANRQEAEKLARLMCAAGHIDQDDLLDKVAELSKQTSDDLRTLGKALELTKQGSKVNFGSLSNQPDVSENPLLDFILS